MHVTTPLPPPPEPRILEATKNNKFKLILGLIQGEPGWMKQYRQERDSILEKRQGFDAPTWSRAVSNITLAQSVCEIIAYRFNLPNSYLLPFDPIASVVFSGGYDYEAEEFISDLSRKFTLSEEKLTVVFDKNILKEDLSHLIKKIESISE